MTLELDVPAPLRAGAAASDGRVVLLPEDRWTAVLPELFDRTRRATVGEVERPPAWWPPDARVGDRRTVRCVAVHEDGDGTPDGYVQYALRRSDALRLQASIEDLAAITGVARRALLAFVASLDLLDRVSYPLAPDDGVWRGMLEDPRRLQTRAWHDRLWLRLEDVPAALALRSYPPDGSAVVEVHQPDREACGYRVEVDERGRAAVEPTAAVPDVALDTADLASAMVGWTSMRALHAQGRVRPGAPGGLARAEACFAVEGRPATTTSF